MSKGIAPGRKRLECGNNEIMKGLKKTVATLQIYILILTKKCSDCFDDIEYEDEKKNGWKK